MGAVDLEVPRAREAGSAGAGVKRRTQEIDDTIKTEARKRMEQLRAGLGRQVPEALACLENGFEAATHFYAFPREHWDRIRSTNGLERLHGEIKRRTRAVGAFPDRASALRLVTAVALQVTAIWTDRRYLEMKLLKSKEIAVARAAGD